MIEKYLKAFPYSYTYISKDSKKLFYLDGKRSLKMLDLTKSSDRNDAVIICNEDFSKRSYNAVLFHDESNLLYFVTDDNNTENFNLYTLNIDDATVTKLTNTVYCGIYGFSENREHLVYGDRYKTEAGRFYTKVYHRNLITNEEVLIADDLDWEYRFAWSNVDFNEDLSKVYLIVDKLNQRKWRNIIEIDLKSKTNRLLLAEDYVSTLCYPLDHRITHENLYFISDCSGIENLYHLNLKTSKTTNLLKLDSPANTVRVDKKHDAIFFAIDENKLDRTAIIKVTPNKDNPPRVQTDYLPGSNSFFSSEDLWISSSNIDQPPTLTRYKFNDKLEVTKELANYRGDKSDLVHNSYQFTEYPSFDDKMVPTFISMPKGDIKGAIVKAFYGGSNFYSWTTQLYAELGYIVLSPGVRGSWDYSKEWRDLIKGDLGGNEILDVHWGARFVMKKFNLEAHQIGVEGGSHGGYAVLRAMTMPKDFKTGIDSDFPYGFGICWAGFADLEDFYKNSNIPDWLVDFLGPYEQNIEKYRERSPVHFVDNLKAPIFIAHGTNDVRVPSSSMDGFLDQLKEKNKPHVLHMMKGLGHGAGNYEEELDLYSKVTSFLNERLKENL